MRTFTPIIIHKNKGLKYEPLEIDKAIQFGERNKNKKVIFETESFGIKEQLTLFQLQQMN